ncbi:MAG: hypothetical protein AAF604_09635 [Acidobacteriota bacterium]
MELAVLRKTLKGESRALELLRAQLKTLQVVSRKITGSGFFSKFEISPERRIDIPDIQFGDVIANITGLAHGAGFLLYLREGQLDLLEGYSFEEPWPREIVDFSLSYKNEDQRDWGHLGPFLNDWK